MYIWGWVIVKIANSTTHRQVELLPLTGRTLSNLKLQLQFSDVSIQYGEVVPELYLTSSCEGGVVTSSDLTGCIT